MGAMVIGATSANASTKVDQNHVRVEQGDTLSQIAHDNGTTVDAIVQANHLTNPNMIFVGDNLVLTPNASSNETATQTPSDGASQHMNQPVRMIENSKNNVNSNQPATTATQQSAPVATSTTGGSSVHNQFINAGGTEAMWNDIVMPESGGNPNASNGQYSGLGQTNQSWGTGSVDQQTQGMINYANSRYGSISNAINFRMNHNFW